MELTGQLTEIIYQNEVNSYLIGILETEEDTITIVGYMPFLVEGDYIKVIGNFVTHKEYGMQFKVETFEKIMPKTLESLEKYLSNGTIKGIGPATAKKIVKLFGEDTINVFKFEPEKLTQIKGITKDKAIEMAQCFVENWELWQIVGFLDNFGISPANAKNIFKKLGTQTIDEIEENPYILIDLVKGVDFAKLDKYALENGFDINNYKRIKCGIKYSLLKITYNGHCCTLKENLIKYVKELLKVEDDDIEHCLIDLNVKEEIVIEKREEENWVYSKELYEAEANIASKLIVLDSAKNIKKISGFNEELEKIEKVGNIKLSSKQKEAIQTVNSNNVVIITGGPGTGKTTIIKNVIEIYKTHGKKVVLCAPTGRAAKRMTEMTGEEAKTLHRLLEIGKIEKENEFTIMNYEVAPIDADVIIVDEASMVDIYLMNYLLNGIYQGTKLILVGDTDQLPSVGPGSVLKDIINSERIKTIFLDEIFRQAAQSKIIVNSHRVNDGEYFLEKEEQKDLKDDFFYIKEKSQDVMLAQLISLCKGRLENFGNYNFFENIQILSPTKKGILGTKELNKKLQEELNPSDDKKNEKKVGDIIFREGDRVMQVKNNYDIYWEKGNTLSLNYETGTGIFNGEIGKIVKIDFINKQIKILFDDEKEAWYAFSDMDQIEHAYAITVHKAQGSEFDVVIVVVTQSSAMLLTRNLLYTGLTRAKKLLILIGNDNVVKFMIQNADTKIRNTGLEYKLKMI
ncbi:MAG TPA: ATP-dependent RecD-like DNA helicase [Clostridiaceae bacterium]|nr:ATP-dependent RecD-like DNA helicase [Clostridium sp.]MEE0127407.1 ATP-dependent RecD-like DNA helicase [Clostridia bacterium]HJJ12613.1 ATP-dependent RecD-like DNA helicase [Clostridiaceae bacterium]